MRHQRMESLHFHQSAPQLSVVTMRPYWYTPRANVAWRESSRSHEFALNGQMVERRTEQRGEVVNFNIDVDKTDITKINREITNNVTYIVNTLVFEPDRSSVSAEASAASTGFDFNIFRNRRLRPGDPGWRIRVQRGIGR